MTDTAYLAAVLSDGCWHSHTEILERSFANRGCGLTVHSRAADLRKRGHVVETRLERDQRGRTLSFYRLVVLDEASASNPRGWRLPGSSSAADASSSAPPIPASSHQGDDAAVSTQSRGGGTLELFAPNPRETVSPPPVSRGAYSEDAA